MVFDRERNRKFHQDAACIVRTWSACSALSSKTPGSAAAAPTTGSKPAAKRSPWPKGLAEQALAVRAALQSRGRAATAEELARTFTRAPAYKVAGLLETLATLGQARAAGEGRCVA